MRTGLKNQLNLKIVLNRGVGTHTDVRTSPDKVLGKIIGKHSI